MKKEEKFAENLEKFLEKEKLYEGFFVAKQKGKEIVKMNALCLKDGFVFPENYEIYEEIIYGSPPGKAPIEFFFRKDEKDFECFSHMSKKNGFSMIAMIPGIKLEEDIIHHIKQMVDLKEHLNDPIYVNVNKNKGDDSYLKILQKIDDFYKNYLEEEKLEKNTTNKMKV